MPVYEYRCPKCKKEIELTQRITEMQAPICCEDNCNVEMTRMISTTSFSLKGSGWTPNFAEEKNKRRR